MAVTVTYRLVKGSPLTSAEHDATLHALVTGPEGLDQANTLLTSHTAELADHETRIDTLETDVAAATTLTIVLNTIYPVGSLYTTTLATNPATLLGVGTWERYAEGLVLAGLDATAPVDAAFATLGQTGGEKAHTLTEAEMPTHSHGVPGTTGGTGTKIGFVSGSVVSSYNGPTDPAGGMFGVTAAHNNLQPYIVVAIWRRTA